jgi:hypothetical protein
MLKKRLNWLGRYQNQICCSEALMHLFSGEPGLDTKILDLLEELDGRERRREGVDYVREIENRLGIKRIVVHELRRSLDRLVTVHS